MFRRRLSRISWLALFAMLGLVCAPALSHALADDVSGPWAQVCSASGYAPGAAQSAPAPNGQLPGNPHCPLCSLHAQPPLLPPAAATFIPPTADDAASGLQAALDAPPQRLAWPHAPARAPPRAS